jgi:hypothetical protein
MIYLYGYLLIGFGLLIPVVFFNHRIRHDVPYPALSYTVVVLVWPLLLLAFVVGTYRAARNGLRRGWTRGRSPTDEELREIEELTRRCGASLDELEKQIRRDELEKQIRRAKRGEQLRVMRGGSRVGKSSPTADDLPPPPPPPPPPKQRDT